MSGRVTVSKRVRGYILAVGVFLILLSWFCSWTLYTGFGGEDSTYRAAWGGIGLGLDMFKTVALIAAFGLWALDYLAARILSVVVVITYLALTALSFTAFFGFMSQIQHGLEQQAVLNSTQYEAARAAVDNAASRVESLSIYADPFTASQAEARIAELNQQKAAILARAAAYTTDCINPKTDRRGSPFTTRMNEACAGYSALADQIAGQQKIVSGFSQYQAAMAHKEQTLTTLSGLDSGSVSTGEFVHPMFVNLGKLFNTASEDAKITFMFISSVITEIAGTISFLMLHLFGVNKRKSYTLEEVEEMRLVAQEHQQRLAAVAVPAAYATMLPATSTAPPIFTREEPIESVQVRQPSLMERLRAESDQPTGAPLFSSAKKAPLAKAINYDDRYFSITIPGWECHLGDKFECFVEGVKTERRLNGFTRDKPAGTDVQVPIISLKRKDGTDVNLSSPMSPNFYKAVDIGSKEAVILLDAHGMPIEI